MSVILHPQTLERRRAMLRTAMGGEICAALADPAVIEVMVNPDGALRLDRLGEGRVDTHVRLGVPEVERIIRLVASHIHAEIHAGNPIVSAELPETGERFEGLLPRSSPGLASRSASRPPKSIPWKIMSLTGSCCRLRRTRCARRLATARTS